MYIILCLKIQPYFIDYDNLSHQVTAWVPDMFYNFYLVKLTELTITQQQQKVEKNKHGFRILRILEILLCMFN
jgi:hypothetical protein